VRSEEERQNVWAARHGSVGTGAAGTRERAAGEQAGGGKGLKRHRLGGQHADSDKPKATSQAWQTHHFERAAPLWSRTKASVLLEQAIVYKKLVLESGGRPIVDQAVRVSLRVTVESRDHKHRQVLTKAPNRGASEISR